MRTIIGRVIGGLLFLFGLVLIACAFPTALLMMAFASDDGSATPQQLLLVFLLVAIPSVLPGVFMAKRGWRLFWKAGHPDPASAS